jgi:hypothetical protein
MNRHALPTALAMLLVACGPVSETPGALQEAKDQAADVAGVAARAAAEVIDTRTACMLAGKPEAFCGCLAEELGPRIDPQHMEAIAALLRGAIDGVTGDAATNASDIEPETRDAFVSCITKAAIEGAGAEQ